MKIVNFELTKKRLIIAAAGAIALFILVIYVIFYAPLIREAGKKCLECKSIEGRLLEARDIIECAGGAHTAQEMAMITEADVSWAIDELTKYCGLMEINIISMKPLEIINGEEPRYRILPIEMRIDSQCQKFAAFIGSLAGLKKGVIKVKSFDLTPDEEDNRSLKANLTLDMYLAGTEVIQHGEEVQSGKISIPVKHRAKKTKFTSWGRNPFLPKGSSSAASDLAGILWDEKSPKAIIGGIVVGIGDRVGGNTVVDIQKDRVILNDGAKDFEVGLK